MKSRTEENSPRDRWVPRCMQALKPFLVMIPVALSGCATSSIHVAAANGDQEQVKRLLERGADVNSNDGEFNTPLHQAITAGKLGTAELLIRHGADVDATGSTGSTPLYVAARDGFTPGAKLLIQHGADPNKLTDEGIFPLMAAAVNGHEDCVALLLRSGANTKTSYEGITALSVASYLGRTKIVRLLDPDAPPARQIRGVKRGGAYHTKELILVDDYKNFNVKR